MGIYGLPCSGIIGRGRWRYEREYGRAWRGEVGKILKGVPNGRKIAVIKRK